MKKISPSQPIIRRHTRLLSCSIESPYSSEGCHPIVQSSRGCFEAVSEGEEDTGACTEGNKGTHQPPVQSSANTIVGEQRSENGEGEDGGSWQQNVETCSATEDRIGNV
ncbi:hypothetical protein PanWU01x14_255730 [Parasponia andersonii]|uniref:Uncharacterized protein n=1 Tax=Parasponia andersonii TaxID=3476 RepID=A0A2P5BAW4_PARAD|nr:hypothetical protein PanWU01x14_255730 [Parasponia andersonii]